MVCGYAWTGVPLTYAWIVPVKENNAESDIGIYTLLKPWDLGLGFLCHVWYTCDCGIEMLVWRIWYAAACENIRCWLEAGKSDLSHPVLLLLLTSPQCYCYWPVHNATASAQSTMWTCIFTLASNLYGSLADLKPTINPPIALLTPVLRCLNHHHLFCASMCEPAIDVQHSSCHPERLFGGLYFSIYRIFGLQFQKSGHHPGSNMITQILR